jgi:hypothetical protein
VTWHLSHRADPACLPLADRHYNRQKPGTPQFVPPGRCIVLKAFDPSSNNPFKVGAFWITSWPFGKYVKHRWPGAWVCSSFRRECPWLGPASDLIREAIAATRSVAIEDPVWEHGRLPDAGIVTFIDREKVRPVTVRGVPTWGRTYRLAGFSAALCPEHNWSADHLGPPRDCSSCRSETAGRLLAFQMLPDAMPEPAPPRSFTRSLFDEVAPSPSTESEVGRG